MEFKYPIYIISKGRAYNPLTAKLFEKANIDYLIAVEPQEKDEYVKALGKKRVLVLPFSNLGLGSYPARNFCWEHAKERGHKYHWLFDDNFLMFKKWVTSSCVYYMAKKTDTGQKMKGGNQTELYKGNAKEKKILKAKMLEAVWPQYTKTVIRFNRPHHFVDWKKFKPKK